MERSKLKIGDKVKIDKKYQSLINVPIQTIKKIEGRYFWSEHFNACDVKFASHIVINGNNIKLTS